MKGLSLPGHLHQGAIRVAVAIPERVAAAKHLVASFAHDVVGRIAKQPFCAAVPAENPLVLVDCEAGFEGAVGDRRGLGAALAVPASQVAMRTATREGVESLHPRFHSLTREESSGEPDAVSLYYRRIDPWGEFLHLGLDPPGPCR